METVECDYLVIGAGATGLAFADELLTQTTGLTVLMVDKRAQPGGHWNDAYPYVRLHQPSHWYGVNSKKLERAPARSDGENELASGQEVVAYFQDVLAGWKDTGRLRFMPKCEVEAGGYHVASLLEPGRRWEVKVRRKVVDSTYTRIEVPSTTPPKYTVAPGALLVPPNSLPAIAKPHPKYVVIGAGKTGIDAVTWLLRQGVAPERLQWVMPRDPWLLNRKFLQPGGIILKYPEALAAWLGKGAAVAERGDEALQKLALRREKTGVIMRVDESVWPEAFQCATVNEEELEQLRRIKPNIIRMGRVQEVGVDRLLLDRGEVATGEGTLHVDCTADGLPRRPPVPIFAEGRITLQPMRHCMPTLSAAMTAYIESKWPADDAKKNSMAEPCPSPNCLRDWSQNDAIMARNEAAFVKSGGLRWLLRSRLNFGAHLGILPPLKFMAGQMLKSTRERLRARL